MKNIRIGIVVFTFSLGSIFPFVDYLVVIEMFYLLIPLALLFFASLALIIFALFSKTLRSNSAISTAWIVPVFIISQFISTSVVDEIQSYRSKLVIDEIECAVLSTGKFPTNRRPPIGIELQHFRGETNFRIRYSRGFMVTEVYESRLKSWKSYGWND